MCFPILASMQMFYGCGHRKVIVNVRLESCDLYSLGNKFPSGQYPLLSGLWEMIGL